MLREHGIDATSLDGLSQCDLPGDMHDLPFADNSFDLVAARHSLEHVKQGGMMGIDAEYRYLFAVEKSWLDAATTTT